VVYLFPSPNESASSMESDSFGGWRNRIRLVDSAGCNFDSRLTIDYWCFITAKVL